MATLYPWKPSSLIYNKDIIPKAPTSFESMFALNKELKKKDKKTIMWDQVQPYFTMPMLAANGGYVFKQTQNRLRYRQHRR